MRSLSVLASVLVLTAGLCFAADTPPSPDVLVESALSSWQPLRVRLHATMTVHRANRDPLTTEILIRRAGSERTRVDFLAPEKDRGKALLQEHDETWLYIPRTGRVIEVPAKRSPLAGGVMFEDIFPDEGAGDSATVEALEDRWVLVVADARNRTRRRPGTTRIYFDRTTKLPVRREIYSPSGRLIKTIEIEEMGKFNGIHIPWRLRFEDHVKGDVEARIQVLTASPLTEEDEALINRENLTQPAVTKP